MYVYCIVCISMISLDGWYKITKFWNEIDFVVLTFIRHKQRKLLDSKQTDKPNTNIFAICNILETIL